MVAMPVRHTNKIWINLLCRDHSLGIASQKWINQQFDAIRFDPEAGMPKPAQSSCHYNFSMGYPSDYGSSGRVPSQILQGSRRIWT
jgi:hypothetical protein